MAESLVLFMLKTEVHNDIAHKEATFGAHLENLVRCSYHKINNQLL